MIKNVFLISLLIALLMLSSILLVGCNNVEEPAETQKSTEAAATGAPTQKPTEPETENEEKKMDESKFNVFFDQE